MKQLFLEPLERRQYFADIAVTTNQDVINPTDGVTSLREAVTLANTLPGADSIILKSGLTYTLNATNGRQTNLDGRQGYASQLTLTGDLTIKTDDTARTTITSNGNGRLFTAGDALGTATNVKFDGGAYGLFLTGGVADQGGALLVRSGAGVSTYNVNFQNNKAVGLTPYTSIFGGTSAPDSVPAYGGSIYVNGGALAMDTSSVSTSVATGTAGGFSGTALRVYGGGVAAGGGIAVNGGSISLTNVSINNNAVEGGRGTDGASAGVGYGGGVAVLAGNSSFTNSLFLKNKTRAAQYASNTNAFGGGLYFDPSANAVTITGGKFQENVVDGVTAANGNRGNNAFGGAIAAYTTLTLNNVDFVSNGANAGRGGEAVVVSGANNSIKPGDNGDAYGGAIFAAGTLTMNGGSFVRNGVIGSAVDTSNQAPEGRGRDTYGANGGTVRGGAVATPTFGGNLTFTNVLFDTNVALAAAGGLGRQTDSNGYFDGYDGVDGQDGVRGGNGGNAFGGAITFDNNATLAITGSTFRSNIASGGRGGDGSRGEWGYDDGDIGGNGGNGGDGGTAGGGAISHGGLGSVVVTGSKLLKNLVGAGDGGSGGYGGRGGTAKDGGSFGGWGGKGGGGGNGGAAYGGAINAANGSAQLIITTTALAGNDVRGGFGGNGGIGGSGMPGSYPATNFHDYDTDGGTGGNGGDGGRGGSAYGGAVAARGTLALRSSTVSDNTAVGGNSGSGGLGGYGGVSTTDKDGDGGYGGLAYAAADAYGGGVYAAGAASVLSSTVVRNTVSGGAGGNGGSGGAAPGGAVSYKPATVGLTDAGTVGGQAAVGAALLIASGTAVGVAVGTVTVSTVLATATAAAGITSSVALAAAGAGLALGLAGGLVVAPVAISGAVIVGTYGVFSIISAVAAIQALVDGSDAGSAFLAKFADLNRYGSPADNADGPNAAALFNFNSTTNRTRGYSPPASGDGADAIGHGGGVYTVSGVTMRNSIVAANTSNRGYLSTSKTGDFEQITVTGNDGFPVSPLSLYTRTIAFGDQGDLTLGAGSITSNGHNLFGVAPKGEANAVSGGVGDKTGSADSYALKPAAYDSVLTTLPIAYTTNAARDKGENLAVTATDQLGNARNRNAIEDIGAVELKPYVPGANVSSVWVSSTSWSQAFKDQLYKQGLATATGFVYVNANRPLPWANIDQVQVNFDRTVTLTADSFPKDFLPAVKSFTDFGGGLSGRWTFASPLTGFSNFYFDQRNIVGPGDELDPSLYPSSSAGSGTITILPLATASVSVVRGDVTGDGRTSSDDVNKVRLAMGSSTTVRTTIYNVWADIDGDGKIAANDLTLAQARVS